MPESSHPFVDNGEGYPTPASVQAALGMFKLDRLANLPISFMGQSGTMVDLVARCRIEHLTQNWPKGFIAQVIGSASQASPTSGRPLMLARAFETGSDLETVIRAKECPFLAQLGDSALDDVRLAYDRVEAGDFDAIGELAERLAAAAVHHMASVEQPSAQPADEPPCPAIPKVDFDIQTIIVTELEPPQPMVAETDGIVEVALAVTAEEPKSLEPSMMLDMRPIHEPEQLAVGVVATAPPPLVVRAAARPAEAVVETKNTTVPLVRPPLVTTTVATAPAPVRTKSQLLGLAAVETPVHSNMEGNPEDIIVLDAAVEMPAISEPLIDNLLLQVPLEAAVEPPRFQELVAVAATQREAINGQDLQQTTPETPLVDTFVQLATFVEQAQPELLLQNEVGQAIERLQAELSNCTVRDESGEARIEISEALTELITQLCQELGYEDPVATWSHCIAEAGEDRAIEVLTYICTVARQDRRELLSPSIAAFFDDAGAAKLHIGKLLFGLIVRRVPRAA